MWKRMVLIAVGALVALAVSGCSGNDSSDSGGEHPAAHTTSAPAAAATAAPDAQTHNNADVMFVRHMIPHHQQAVEMSDIVLGKQGIDPRVTQLANQIKAAQGPEIQQMQQWLTEWGNPPMPAMPSGDMDMPGHGDMSGMPAMQGMMSEQELDALRNAQGVDASRMFLGQMIAHHEGAIAMAQNEIEEGQYPPAVGMARTIVETQQEEIDTMKGILASL